jgi:hypothetical protein
MGRFNCLQGVRQDGDVMQTSLQRFPFGSFGPSTVWGFPQKFPQPVQLRLGRKRPCEIPFLDVTSARSEVVRGWQALF